MKIFFLWELPNKHTQKKKEAKRRRQKKKKKTKKKNKKKKKKKKKKKTQKTKNYGHYRAQAIKESSWSVRVWQIQLAAWGLTAGCPSAELFTQLYIMAFERVQVRF
jgi:hypothetical protein